MPTKVISFSGSAGDELSARLELPVGGEPLEYALFAHCFTCSKNLKAAVNVTRALARERVGVLRFDFTGLGESEGDFADTNFSSNVEDLVAAAEYMDGRRAGGPVDPGRPLPGWSRRPPCRAPTPFGGRRGHRRGSR